MPPAVQAFWDAFHDDDYERLPALITALEEARAATPGDFDLEFIAAHAQLWQIAEASRNPSSTDAATLEGVMNAVDGFERAEALRPDDARIPCWRGLLQLQTGRLFGDATLIEAGQAGLDRAVEEFPEFGWFCRFYADWEQPVESEAFQAAVQAGWNSVDVCTDTPMDREHPDVAPFLDQATDEGPRRVCWNLDVVPHNEEGYWLMMGDLLAKDGQTDVARTLYENARYRDSYDSWIFRPELEARLTTLDDRVASYRDADPTNDAALGLANGCVVCHAD